MYGFENELEKAKKISEIYNSNFYEYDQVVNLEEFQKRFISKSWILFMISLVQLYLQ